MKKLSKPLIVILSIVLAIVVVIVALCLSFVKPLNVLDGYAYVNLYSADGRLYTIEDAHKDEFDQGLKSTKYSIMHGVLEGTFSNSPEFKYKLDSKNNPLKDDSGNKVKDLVKAPDIEGYLKAAEGAYLLEFVYSDYKNVKVDGEDVKFNRARVLIKDTNGEIFKSEVLFYDYARIGNEAEDEETGSMYYEIAPVNVKFVGTKLYHTLTSIIEKFN